MNNDKQKKLDDAAKWAALFLAFTFCSSAACFALVFFKEWIKLVLDF